MFRYEREYRGRDWMPGPRRSGWSAEPYYGGPRGRPRGGYGGDYPGDRGGWGRGGHPRRFTGGLDEYYSGTFRNHGPIGQSSRRGGMTYSPEREHRGARPAVGPQGRFYGRPY